MIQSILNPCLIFSLSLTYVKHVGYNYSITEKISGDINKMNFEEAVQYISDAGKYGIVPGLDSIKRLCHELSDPQEKLKFVHIAGTNGKGSVGTFINSVLKSAGYKTGRYVSPAVMDYLEKIQYDNQNISKDEFAAVIGKVKTAADSVVSLGFPHPTVFELETAAAFCYFAEKCCDIVLLEVGMGGRTDATNIITKSELSVITSISLEHTQYLGDTLEKIAKEKAGIVKKNGTVVTLTQNPAVTDTIIKICKKQSANLTITKLYNITDYKYAEGVQTFSYQELENLKISLLGKYQTENAALAVDACKLLARKGYKITDGNIYEGLESARWPGRFEIIRSSSPMIIVDGAHNSSAAVRLRETIDIYFSDKRIAYIMGTFKDKNYAEIARQTAKRAAKIYTVSTEGSRGLEAEKLAETIKQYNSNVTAAASFEEAVSACIDEKYNIIIAFGSLSFLSKIKECVNGEIN